MTFPHKAETDGQAHDEANQKLDAALDERARMSDQKDAAQGGSGELAADVQLAAADDQVAAREAWVKYIEHGY